MSEKYKLYVTKEIAQSLKYDAASFEFLKKDGNINTNAFLRTLISNYYPIYNDKNANISRSVNDEIISLTNIDRETANLLSEKVIQLCANHFTNNYNSHTNSNVNLTLTVSGSDHYLLESICASHNDKGLSQYLRGLFESYLSLPGSVKETILFDETYKSLQGYIKNKMIIIFTIKKSQNTIKNKYYKILPYKLLPSKEGLFNYLLGYDIENKRASSFRLSRIEGLTTNHKTMSFPENIVNKLKASAENAPQFSFNDALDVVVKFTEEGKKKYRMIYTNRPILSYVDNEGNYHFKWPEDQIFEYLIRFGKEAKIIKPASLIDKLRNYYTEALSIYTKQ